MEAAHCFTAAMMAQLTGKCCPQRPSIISLNRGKKADASSGRSVVCLLLVFHIIISWTKEKNYVSQKTSRSEKEDTSRKIRHLVARGASSLSLAAGRGVGVLSKPCAFIK